MSDSKVELTIPAQMIDAIVQAEIVRQLGSKEELVESVVRAAMNAPAPKRSYGSTPTVRDRATGRMRDVTMLEHKAQEMIRNAALEGFQEWVDSHRDEIKRRLITELTKSKAKVLRGIVDSFVDQMKSFRLSVRLDLQESE